MSDDKLSTKRWGIAVAAIIMQLCLGTVYAWSVFKKPLMAAHGWGETATQVTFMICIGMIGLSAAFGGMLVDKKGPRFVATIGGILFGIGTLLAGLADQTGNLILLYLSFGFLAGLGNGFGYVTPIATLIRWFPDKRGLVTGLAVMGFGGGAFFMGKIAPQMINGFAVVDPSGVITSSGVSTTFYIWGAIFLVLVTASAQFYKNPPQGWLPAGFTPSPAKASCAGDSMTFSEGCRTPQWWALWGMLFLNITAGIGLLSQLSPLAQDVLKRTVADPAALAVAGGTIVAIASIFNGLGRLFWAWLSDGIGRKNVFLIMFITQAILYMLLPKIGSELAFTVIACYLLACYGGGFATMPAFCADSFGPACIGRIYGTMLTAWGVAGIVGPLLFAQFSKQMALNVAAVLLLMGMVITAFYRAPVKKTALADEVVPQTA